MSIKLLIADDDSLIRESLKIIIGMDSEFKVLNCVENGIEAFEFCRKNEVDVALLDVRMPIMNGVEAARDIVKNTNTKVLILTTFDEDEYIKQAIKFGASGYILKNNSPEEIKNSIKLVYNGKHIMENNIFERVKENINNHVEIPDIFTERELDIIESISEGLSNKEISQKLFLSEGTVKNYISSILSKTGLKHRTQIAIYYLKGGKI